MTHESNYQREVPPPMPIGKALWTLAKFIAYSPVVVMAAGLAFRVLAFFFKLGYNCFGLW